MDKMGWKSYAAYKKQIAKLQNKSLFISKEIQPVHPKGNQSWTFTGRTDVEAGIPILWPPDLKSWLIWKDPDAENDWRQEEKRTTDDEMVGWHHRLSEHEAWVNSGSWWWTGRPGVLHCGVAKTGTRLSNWTELISNYFKCKWIKFSNQR